MGKNKIKEYLNNKIGIETVMVKNEINSDKELKMCQSILDYIEELEEKEKRIKEYLNNGLKSVKKCQDRIITTYPDGTKAINVTGLTKKQKDELANERNCLYVQAYCYEEILNLYNDKEG